jgi:transglutaminase-like putative cysteine protease
MIAIARSWGVPSRYVSGYLHTTGLSGEQTVATGSHAWVECRLPGAGWVGFDPTNATVSDERHIRVAAGRDYADVSATSGVFRGNGDAEIEVDVIVNVVAPLGQDETVSGRNRRQRG